MNPVWFAIVSEESDGTWEYSASEIKDVSISKGVGELMHTNALTITITLQDSEYITKRYVEEFDFDDEDDDF